MHLSNFKFEVTHQAKDCGARAGKIETPHGEVETPVFMPVGTLANVKTLTPKELAESGASIVLGNTYHLYSHPGVEVVEQMRGLAAFMGWNGPTLTDSGGFQVFSLSDTRKLTEEGVEFRSVYDGSLIKFTPESVFELQRAIGADFTVALDECPPWPCSYDEVKVSGDLTRRWAERFIKAFKGRYTAENATQAPFLVTQGGTYPELRRQCAEEMAELDPWGFGIGGVSVGEPHEEMIRAASVCCETLPGEKPRHLLGVGKPRDILRAIEVGVDMFDCVLPTRNGRNGQALTSVGAVNLRNSIFKRDDTELDPSCSCYCCQTFSRSYLHHLVLTGELLGGRLLSLHNVHFFISLAERARNAIRSGEYRFWAEKTLSEMRN